MDRDFQPLPFAVLDDCDGVYKSEDGANLLKTVTNTQDITYPTWDSSSKLLEKVGMLKRFGTRARVAITSNDYTSLRSHLQPVIDRGPCLILQYTPATIHSDTPAWFLDGSQAAQEVYDFIGENLPRITGHHSFRTYFVGKQLYVAGLDWKRDLEKSFVGLETMTPKDKAFAAMIQVMCDARFRDDRSLTPRCQEWQKLTGQSMPAFYRWQKEWIKLGKPGE